MNVDYGICYSSEKKSNNRIESMKYSVLHESTKNQNHHEKIVCATSIAASIRREEENPPHTDTINAQCTCIVYNVAVQTSKHTVISQPNFEHFAHITCRI